MSGYTTSQVREPCAKDLGASLDLRNTTSDSLKNEISYNRSASQPHDKSTEGGDELTSMPADWSDQPAEPECDDGDSPGSDQEDKFKLKKFLRGAAKSAKKLLPKRKEKDIDGPLELVISDDDEYGSNRPVSENRSLNNRTTRQTSLTKALDNPIPINVNEYSQGVDNSSDKDKQPEKRVPDPYPCQTNIQIHPNPKFPRSQVLLHEDQYDFTHPERGYLVMIVNDRFKRQLNREGAHWDLIKMKEVARKLGFRLFNYDKERNLSKAETLQLLRRAQQADHSKCDSFMFMISSHGLEQPNVRARGKPDHALVCADDQLIFTSSILEMFNDENCPSLKNKPKLFIVQACRGENLDHGGDVFVTFPKCSVDVTDITRIPLANVDITERSPFRENLRSKPSVDEPDTKPGPGTWSLNEPTKTLYDRTAAPKYCVPKLQQHSSSHGNVSSASSRHINKIYAPTPYAIVDTPSLMLDNDMLVMYAIPEGMFAWRNTSDGSWMIDYLHQVIMMYDMRRPKNFLLLLTKVSAIMSKRTTNTPSAKYMDKKKAVPVIEHKLLKDVVFQQKVTVSDWIKEVNI